MYWSKQADKHSDAVAAAQAAALEAKHQAEQGTHHLATSALTSLHTYVNMRT
jgi:hypothetical protein